MCRIDAICIVSATAQKLTGSALQEDIAATTRALLSKGQDILGRRLWSHNDAFSP